MPWICCQRGAREHYAVPRGLARAGVLGGLLTDVWWPWGGGRGFPLLQRLRGRHHPEIPAGMVHAFNGDFLLDGVLSRFRRPDWFRHEQDLNRLFQRRSVAALRRMARDGQPRVVFAYSYAARDILAFARDRGWQTVLGQIDPGPRESEIVLEEYRRLGLSPGRLYTPPPDYWDDWRRETELADVIAVNSRWSAACLQEAGVPPARIHVVPCAFEASVASGASPRIYPPRFTVERPLRALFLGQTIVRKGIHLLMEAAADLLNEPIQFVVIGSGLDHPALAIPRNVDWRGPVSRAETALHYGNADVFVLPTLSDGFALTQLEAMARRLPVIATSHCGEVVSDGVNGMILPENSGAALSAAFRRLLEDPASLERMSAQATVPANCSVTATAEALIRLVRE